MKKKIFTVIFLIISILWISGVNAQRPGSYQRKKVQPDFFIPNSARDKPEQLPDFYMLDQPEKTNPVKPDVIKQVVVQEIEPEVEVLDENDNEETVEENSLAANSYIHLLEEYDLRELPLYKQKYDEYTDDLKIIGETKTIPENNNLTADLAAMDSNLKIVVDDDFGIK
ncbi:MAG: hypothetical protein LBR70_02525 [Lactobacillaceae bacterium]|jgi:hypothetical protein|nr:hypothetical protein [Lactobacillaceae bacterium]